MTRAFLTLSALPLALGLAVPAAAVDEHIAFTPDSIKWEPAPPLPAGANWSVLYGDPKVAGPFAVRVRFPDGYRMPAHWHSKDEVVTVISGTFGVGTGEKASPDKVQKLPAGGLVALPARMPHYAFMTGDTEVQINGTGPFDLNYVNPSEDPRKQVGSSQ